MSVINMNEPAIRGAAETCELSKIESPLLGFQDGLTGLSNHTAILRRINAARQRSHGVGLDVALLFIDLDGFKLVNDTYGHDAGDVLLNTVARRLREQVCVEENVARLSSDEFIVLCERVHSASEVSALADRINRALRLPIDHQGMKLYVTASIGIVIADDGDQYSGEDMLRDAEAAMYAIKQKDRDNWQVFDETLRAQAQQRIQITNGLRFALERNELSVRFQPIVMADTGCIVGAEVLLRWFPAGGEVPPSVFIPVAEMTRLIVPIGAWVFRQACCAEVEWRRRWGDKAPYVSVNMSPHQLNEASLVESFTAILQETGADPKRLVIEITETALMADVEANMRLLHRLANMGFRVAVDDFGTGYSSLAQLTRLPVAVLKIDRAFIDGIDQSPESRTVIRAVIGLGRELGLTMIAEGVETAAQQLELCGYGCDFIQGYHFHRPMEEAALVATIDRELRDGAPNAVAALHFLIYASEAVEPMSTADLDSLIYQTRMSNRSMAVTGCLVYRDGLFMQILEGRRDVVLALFEKIKMDSRHKNARLVIEGKAQCRVYADWNMALRNLTSAPDKPDFNISQNKSISFLDLAQDARICHAFITGLVSHTTAVKGAGKKQNRSLPNRDPWA
jgi:diguanylate cyclase (GGDEF)-like protein